MERIKTDLLVVGAGSGGDSSAGGAICGGGVALLASLIAGHGLWAGSWWVHEAFGSLSHVASYAAAAWVYRRATGAYAASARPTSLLVLAATGALGAVGSYAIFRMRRGSRNPSWYKR